MPWLKGLSPQELLLYFHSHLNLSSASKFTAPWVSGLNSIVPEHIHWVPLLRIFIPRRASLNHQFQPEARNSPGKRRTPISSTSETNTITERGREADHQIFQTKRGWSHSLHHSRLPIQSSTQTLLLRSPVKLFFPFQPPCLALHISYCTRLSVGLLWTSGATLQHVRKLTAMSDGLHFVSP